ncbi:MAG: type II toxin-antitoxin system VapC family toxin [Deltaproteobacteria bacterium]|nr:type II toxin-antitoxin system VapC family toxin [Deltaproteobacteria bacterium]
MKRIIFLDTGYLIALIRKKDQFHAVAMEASGLYSGPFLTTVLVLVELANSLSKPLCRKTVITVIEKIQTNSNTTVIPFASEGMSKAFSLFKRRKDKAWGMVDCYSFVVMKKRRVRYALTFDDHFRQAGFDTPLIG